MLTLNTQFYVSFENSFEPGLMPHVYNPSILTDEAVGLFIQGQPRLYSEFQARLGYVVRPSLN